MTVPLPKFDERTAREVSAEVRRLLSAAHWPEEELDRKGSFENALIHAFGRFAELIIQRLNRAPEKNLLAFLDLLGVSQLPMQAARVPLTFSMAPGSASCARVPKGTQVAAPPAPGAQKPVVFETEQELMVTPAKLDSLLIKYGGRDQHKDLGAALILPSDGQTGAGGGEVAKTPVGTLPVPIPHVFYLAVPVNASWPKIDQLRVQFGLEEGASAMVDARLLQWEMPTEDDPPRAAAGVAKAAGSAVALPLPVVLIPSEDGTKNLTQSGEVVFLNPPRVAPVAINGVAGSWLSCRLLTPIAQRAEAVDKMVRASQLPAVKQVTCAMQLARRGLAIEQAFYNVQRLDVTKDFFPFGERPKFGDVLYLASREVFSDPDAKITLHVELTSPEASGRDAGAPNTPTPTAQLSWEFWNGQSWTKLEPKRYARLGDRAGNAVDAELEDGTNSFTTSGDVSFRFSSAPQELIVNGQKNYWIRVRIAAGNYGEEQQFQKGPSGTGLVAQPATLAPPSIKSIKLDYVVTKEAPPTAILTYNDFAYAGTNAQGPFKPFAAVAAEDAAPEIYVGFAVDAPAGSKPAGAFAALNPAQAPAKQGKFPNQAVTAYVAAGDVASQKSGGTSSLGAVATWEYWNGVTWTKVPVRDETRNFRRSGLMQFLPPADFATKKEFGRERYWLRMRPNAEDYDTTVRNVYLNTTMAVQGISVVNDILGTSDGKAKQKFQTIQPMVLSGQKLEVYEPTMPPQHECKRVKADEGDDAIQTVWDPKDKVDHYWVTWHEKPNFYESDARSRHYVLDRVKGEVTFGDGTCGLIPPVLPGNIRMTSYRSGGGVAGNQPPQAVTKLTSAVAYIQKVVNYLPAGGGTDAEENARLMERGSRGVRHGGRAVTFEDFEDLAMLASRDVARAKCVPLRDLSAGPEARRSQPGLISLIVVPRSRDPKPMPSYDLLEDVRAYVDAGRLPGIEMVVVGPEYVRVDVEAEIAVNDPGDASDVELAVRQELERYLHPITGGPDGCGWEFGRLPRKFDLSVLIERIPGVSHVRDLRVSTVAGRPGVERTGNFLICCGQHQIAMTLEEQSAVEFA